MKAKNNPKQKPLTLEQIKKVIKDKKFNRFYRSEKTQKKYDLEKEVAITNLKDELKKQREKHHYSKR